MGKNILAAVLLGLFLFGGAPAEAATSEVAIGSQVELQEVMRPSHRPPQRNRKFTCVYPRPPKQVKQVRERTPNRPPWRCGFDVSRTRNRSGHVPHHHGGCLR